MSKWELREEVLRALPFIFGLNGNSTKPENLSELLKIFYPEYKDRTNVSKTKEYMMLGALLRRRRIEKWLAAIFGKFPESELAQCSPEERELAEAILRKYPNGYNVLRQQLSDFLMGSRPKVHDGEKYH